VWALPGIARAGGTATLVDIDPVVSATASRNFATLGIAGHVEVVVDDAIAYAARLPTVDLAVLDAEGPKDNCPDELRDKAIYGPITAAVTPNLRPGGLLVAHNMMLDNLSDNAYFAERIADNRRQFARFEARVSEAYDARCLLATTEGVGVYRRNGTA
jgi:predicted O-methyltransferase YrrM